MSHTYNLRSLPHRDSGESSNLLPKYDDLPPKYEEQNESITVFIKTLMGKTFEMNINKSIKFMEFFKLVEEKTGIHKETFYFVYNHYKMPKFEEINSEMKISDFNVKDNSNLHLVLRLGGRHTPFVYNRSDWFKLS